MRGAKTMANTLRSAVAFFLVFSAMLPATFAGDFSEVFSKHPVTFQIGLQKQLSLRSKNRDPNLAWFDAQEWQFMCGVEGLCFLRRAVIDCAYGTLNFTTYLNDVGNGDLAIDKYVPENGVLRFRFREKPMGEEWVSASVTFDAQMHVIEIAAEVTEWGRLNPRKNLGTYEFVSDKGTFEREIPCRIRWPGIGGPAKQGN